MFLNKKNLPLFFFILFAALLAGAAFYLFWSFNDTPGVSSVEVKEAARAKREAEVKASPNQQLQKFSLTGFNNSGKKSWNLEGESANIDPGQTVFLDENVTLRFHGSTVVKTDHVRWTPDGGTLKTAAPVHVDHPSAKIDGIGAYGRPNENFIQINKNIKMLVQPNTVIICEGPMKMYYEEHKMIFYRNVVVTDQRGVLKANRMDVFFDPETNKVKNVIAVGNVVIERGSDTTRSKRAIYTLETGSVRLEGNPEVTVHKNSKFDAKAKK